ncbi:MAG TPA: DUF305 domain-containing protein [Vicinamibacterales bacterium]|nr:DUF305 domain-containing protein [Vicinamibacterales bacterium]
MLRPLRSLIVLAVAAVAIVACRTAAPVPAPDTQPAPARPAVVQPGAPGQVSTTSAAAAPVTIAHVKADVEFMQGMIGHHAQALEMVDLLQTRTESSDMKLLALRIKVSQQDEIKAMQEWLRDRGETAPGEHAHHAHGFTPMPGMLTAENMARLRATKGREFDRLFLEYMIKHHEGALVMVDQLYKTDGAGQEAMINAFASDVVADQQMEIDRMIAMWRGLQK